MGSGELEHRLAVADLSWRDDAQVARLVPALRLLARYFRAEVRGVERVPDAGDRGVLVVANTSGGLLPTDVPVVATALLDRVGPGRLFVLAPDALLAGLPGRLLRRLGLLPATPAVLRAALASGATVLALPGGAHDAFRPTSRRNVVDFGGHADYAAAAREADVPVVPVVSIGGQEAQLHLARGEGLARALRLADRLPGRLRPRYLPLTVGFPFGLTALPVNVPLPTKIVTQVLEPLDPAGYPDAAALDVEVRRRMQRALDDLARERRFPVLG